MKRQWYRIDAKAEQPSAELDIYGDIGASYWDDDAVSAKSFIDDLKALPAGVKALTVRVNSLGGSVFDGIAIANALRLWAQAEEGRTIEMVVEGIAASIASAVIMAGTTIRIGDNAMVMVHNPWTLEIGNSAAMRKMADTLDKIRDSIVATYQWHSKMSAEELIALLDAETWMSADEAIANGFATEKVEGLKAAASLDPRTAAKLSIPEQFKARVDALIVKPAPQEKQQPAEDQPVAASAADVLRTCREADCLDLAEAFVANGATLADVQAGVSKAKDERQQSAARAQNIRAACESAKLPNLADGYIKGAMSLEDVKAHLATITAVVDKAEIDTNLAPGAGEKKQARINTRAVYAQRNQ